uniref:T-box domain-containing protein n=1 Tax=Schistosoma haematobium TaxID=6185 RepID=A0A095APJ7_SCHHA
MTFNSSTGQLINLSHNHNSHNENRNFRINSVLGLPNLLGLQSNNLPISHSIHNSRLDSQSSLTMSTAAMNPTTVTDFYGQRNQQSMKLPIPPWLTNNEWDKKHYADLICNFKSPSNLSDNLVEANRNNHSLSESSFEDTNEHDQTHSLFKCLKNTTESTGSTVSSMIGNTNNSTPVSSTATQKTNSSFSPSRFLTLDSNQQNQESTGDNHQLSGSLTTTMNTITTSTGASSILNDVHSMKMNYSQSVIAMAAMAAAALATNNFKIHQLNMDSSNLLLSSTSPTSSTGATTSSETSGIRPEVELIDKSLWDKFHCHGTEMVITKSGSEHLVFNIIPSSHASLISSIG